MAKNHLDLIPEKNNLCRFSSLIFHRQHHQKKTRPATLFFETTHSNNLFGFDVNEIIYQGKTEFQQVLICETASFGRALMLDGSIQTTEHDETLYHEMMVHPGMSMHAKPEHVLILGGANGAAVREVLRYPCVQTVTWVEIDAELVDICKKHLPQWNQDIFNDPRLKLVFEDAFAFLKENSLKYDVIISDHNEALKDPDETCLLTPAFSKLLKDSLKSDGLLIFETDEVSFSKAPELVKVLKNDFSHVHPYQVFIPSFLNHAGFIMASQSHNPYEISVENIEQKMIQHLNLDNLQHVHPGFIKQAFNLCKKTLKIWSARL